MKQPCRFRLEKEIEQEELLREKIESRIESVDAKRNETAKSDSVVADTFRNGKKNQTIKLSKGLKILITVTAFLTIGYLA